MPKEGRPVPRKISQGIGDVCRGPTDEPWACILLKQQLEARRDALPRLNRHERPELHLWKVMVGFTSVPCRLVLSTLRGEGGLDLSLRHKLPQFKHLG